MYKVSSFVINIMIAMISTIIALNCNAQDISGTYLGIYLNKSLGINKIRTFSSRRHDGLKGFEKGGYIKFQKDFDQITIGLEPSFTFSNMKGERWHSFGYIKICEKVNKKHGINLCLNIGKKIEPTHFYGKIGITNSSFHFSGILNEAHKHIKGLMIGIGVEIPLTNEWYVGGEYVHTFFEKITLNHPTNYLINRIRASSFFLKTSYKI